MRIIAGEFRHRKLFTPPDATVTRPIPDRAKEALFNLLRGWTEGAVVIDAFAGTGAIGLEAVSRGAARCVFVERDRRIAGILERNITELGCEDRCEVVRADALGPALLTRAPKDADLLFFDPPYVLVQDPAGWERVSLQFSRAMGLLKPKAFAMLRTPWPMRHWMADQATEPEAPRGRAVRDDESEERVWEGEALRELEESDYADAGPSDEESADEPGSPAGHWRSVSLEIAGATGPETHVYGSTAVHLYMPRPAVQ